MRVSLINYCAGEKVNARLLYEYKFMGTSNEGYATVPRDDSRLAAITIMDELRDHRKGREPVKVVLKTSAQLPEGKVRGVHTSRVSSAVLMDVAEKIRGRFPSIDVVVASRSWRFDSKI